jgi:hypothetical protein
VTTASVYGCLRTNGAGVYDATVRKTFVTYSGTRHDIYVKAFDHETRKTNHTGKWPVFSVRG